MFIDYIILIYIRHLPPTTTTQYIRDERGGRRRKKGKRDIHKIERKERMWRGSIHSHLNFAYLS
jgi:hypothetical protein